MNVFWEVGQQWCESKEIFVKVFRASPDPISISTLAEGRYIDVNDSFLSFFGYSRQEVIGSTSVELGLWINPEGRDRVKQLLQTQGAIRNIEFDYRTKSNEIKTLLLSAEIVEVGEHACILCLGKDITERKQVEATLKNSEAKLRNILSTAGAVIARFRLYPDRNWTYEYFSSGTEVIFGYTPQELQTNQNLWLSSIHPEDAETIIPQIFDDILAGRKTKAEFRFQRKDGTWRWISDTLVPCRDESADCWNVTCVEVDITERKRAEEALRESEARLKTSLQEKEVLLKEVHHRVKNNLQIVYSLLDLQSQNIRDPQMSERFQESQNRIRAMALIHEKLYQSNSLAQVDLAEYSQSLAACLIQTYAVNSDNITLQLEVESLILSFDTVIPYGLILNELVSNALKHAFPRNTSGTIWIKLKALPPAACNEQVSQFELVVGNDGVPLPEIPNFSRAKTLGFQLVNVLVQQLQGEIEVEQGKGTEFKFRFAELESFTTPPI
jgi:PAS domain S-box-containing protein